MVKKFLRAAPKWTQVVMERTYSFSLGPSRAKKDIKLFLVLTLMACSLIAWVFQKPFLESREADRVMKAVGLFSEGKPLPASDDEIAATIFEGAVSKDLGIWSRGQSKYYA